MKLSKVRKKAFLYFLMLVGVGCLASSNPASWASSPGGTPETLARWDPRTPPAEGQFVGDRVCAQCHKKLVESYTQTPMSKAMESVADTIVLTTNPSLSFRNGPYSYAIKRNGKESFYTVSNGTENISVPILYAFGQGKAGQTYLFRYEGQLYQSLVSFYDDIAGLDFTIGASNEKTSSLKEAIGRPVSDQEAKNCFGCHSTSGLSAGRINFENVTAGVRCETCHGPGGSHAKAIRAGEPGKNLIFNPTRLSGDELSQEFCSACHRVIDDFDKLRSLQVNNVRFQPYRIFKSKCYSDDRRIRCTACHDPHEPVIKDSAYYDQKCLACHSAKPPGGIKSTAQDSLVSCKVSTKNCVSCHMQETEPPQAHFKFTDHYIRVIRSGESYPD